MIKVSKSFKYFIFLFALIPAIAGTVSAQSCGPCTTWNEWTGLCEPVLDGCTTNCPGSDNACSNGACAYLGSCAQNPPPPPSTAAGTGLVCNARKVVYDGIMSSSGVDLTGTTLIWGAAVDVDKPFYQVFGLSLDEAMNCLSYFGTSPQILGTTDLGKEINKLGCNTTDEKTCKAVANEYTNNGIAGFDNQAFANSKVAGSLLGYVNYLQGSLKYEPVPVNMAYFFKQYAAKLPIVSNSVFAQSATIDYQHTLIEKILVIWQFFRNIAYALMSLIMLWTGLAIIMKKKISQQVVVNVQYALPKVVAALVLIAFSYPIGAMITSFAWTLYNSAEKIVESASVFAGTDKLLAWLGIGVGAGVIVIIIAALMLSTMGIGVAAGAILILLILIILGMWIWAMLKAAFIYFKMVGYIAVSPLQFAMYALPGQDEKLADWFKQMLAWMLGIFSVGLVVQMTQAFALMIMEEAITVTVGQGIIEAMATVLSGSMFGVLAIPLIFVFGFGFAAKAPNLIQNAIMGPPTKRK